ncbi:MAG TPA: hypothetical protein VMW53_11350 [archaeon]|nr:hypothetical protein [archaeon]
MKKNILLFICLMFGLALYGQSVNVIDTIYAPSSELDTLWGLDRNAYTGNITGILIDCRTMDDTTGARFNVGTGWEAGDTTFIQFSSTSLPATVKASDDYQVGFEKIGLAFPVLKIQFTRGSSGTDLKYPVHVTFDRR